jgi:glyceraldehyde 3-phosphate dehydrogenase
MPIRVAISGFGRIGRQIFQAGYKDPAIEWVAVNDMTDAPSLAHLLKWDSVFGRFPADIKAEKDAIIVDGKRLKVFNALDPEQLPWKELGIDLVVESTGKFTDREGAGKHLKAGAKKVFVSAPGKDVDFTLVMGANQDKYDRKKHAIVSNGSCTTNAIVHLAKVLHEAFGIERGYMVTVHSYTADQRLVDGPHKDLRRARAAGVSIIPTTTGAAKTVGEVFPELKGRIDGYALRVPTPDGSIAVLNAVVRKDVTVEQVNKAFADAAKGRLRGILEYADEPLVSRDIIRNPHSCIFDSPLTAVTDKRMVTVSGWYDNEWGFSCRMVDAIKLMMR